MIADVLSGEHHILQIHMDGIEFLLIVNEYD